MKGKGLTRNDISEIGNPCILYGDLYTLYSHTPIIRDVLLKTKIESNDFILSSLNDVIIPASGETALDISSAGCVKKNNVILGGDLNILRVKPTIWPEFITYQIRGPRKYDIARVSQGNSVVHLNHPQLKEICFSIPSIEEQQKISYFIEIIDRRIKVQRKLIEAYESLIKGIIDGEFNKEGTVFLEKDIMEISKRNKKNEISEILSVSNSQGFIKQTKQFYGKNIASDDTTNYKIVSKGDFAYNPARINVGSISRLNTEKQGIISPMYVCFRVREEHILADYFSCFLKSIAFRKELIKKLEGSVRQVLSFTDLCKIKMCIPPKSNQKAFSIIISAFRSQLNIVKNLYNMQIQFKNNLLKALFI